MGLLLREHPKAQPGGCFLLLFLEKPRIEPATPGARIAQSVARLASD